MPCGATEPPGPSGRPSAADPSTAVIALLDRADLLAALRVDLSDDGVQPAAGVGGVVPRDITFDLVELVGQARAGTNTVTALSRLAS